MIENILGYVSSAVVIAGGWNLANGILHDVFVLRSEHGKKYDRNLLRLLMDGHILITCGIILILVGKGVRLQQGYAYGVAAAALLSMIIYCGMIFPFLKSVVTLFINSLTLVILILSFIKK
jgi:low temperature requirement protein LtrA